MATRSIKVWNAATSAWEEVAINQPAQLSLSNSNPLVNGSASSGVSTAATRSDHVHPTDTSRAALASPTLTGTPAAPTAAADTNTTQVATTAYVVGQASAVNPEALGTVAIGASLRYARANHVHPTDRGGS
jgi:hypothetical protein